MADSYDSYELVLSGINQRSYLLVVHMTMYTEKSL